MIDRSRLAELEAEIGAEDTAMIFALYLEEAEEAVARIAAGLPPDDHRRALHFLRSGALNIGLIGVADAADAGAAPVPATAQTLARALADAQAAWPGPATPYVGPP
ncbi:Hpt domain-containing protein [Jannaschia ovalis]|uniref:Hpt domain-containing protein n=1 Tax=Jannaschia ovalis TaxID=3038773 RepID=A0ABY8L7V8_9RHOB|nr:hypothetical protein [Jannaschia sp. GRR-S6-38]WGH77376.1 hypothetical protein P8627_09975 [Jannaschia sp. GRR-S6-38]